MFVHYFKHALVAILLGFFGASSAWSELSDDEKRKAEELIKQIEEGGFAEREAAVKELKKLPRTALPWLEEQVEATPVTDLEMRSRLKSIVRGIKKREAEQALREGSPVKFDLKDVKPEDVLKAVNEELEVALTHVKAGQIWDSTDKADFSYEGSYWGGVEQMLQAYSPKSATGREDLKKNQRMSRWIEEDFLAHQSARTHSGILHVRHGRMALESSGGQDFMVLQLVPTIEPRYQADEVTLLVKGLKFEDGTVLEPQEKVTSGDPNRYNRTKVYTWIFPVKEGVDLSSAVKVEGSAKLKVRRLKWFEIPLPEDVGEAVQMSAGTTLKVIERDEGSIKVEFEGEGREPDCFDDYQLRSKSYVLLDDAGEALDFSVRSSSSGGGKGWKNSYKGSVKGEPKKIRARLPDAEQEVQLKFELENVPIPGAALVKGGGRAKERPAAKGISLSIKADGAILLNKEMVALDALEGELEKIKDAAGGTVPHVVLAADDKGKTITFVEVINVLAKVGIKNITMTGFREPGGQAEVDVSELAELIAAKVRDLEAKVDLAVPAEVEGAGEHVGEIIVTVAKDGSIHSEGKEFELGELTHLLEKIAEKNKDQAVIIRGDRDTPFDKIVAVLGACQEAGIWNVAFATRKKDD